MEKNELEEMILFYQMELDGNEGDAEWWQFCNMMLERYKKQLEKLK